MANHRGSAVAAARRSLFSTEDRGRLLEQALGVPTGVVVTIGGVDFDLVPLAFADGRKVLELAERLGGLFGRAKAGALEEQELIEAISTDGDTLMSLTKKILSDSSFTTSEDEDAIFEEWFALLPMIPTLQLLAPAVIRANSPKLGNAPAPMAVVSTPTSVPEHQSDLSTSSGTSSPTIDTTQIE